MSGLRRVTSLYKLLERVREAEALAARSGVVEVEAQLDTLRQNELALSAAARSAPEDAVLRTAEQYTVQSAAVLRNRLSELRAGRLVSFHAASEELAASRLRVRQVEQVLQAAEHQAKQEAEKREQLHIEERFLARRYRAERTAARLDVDPQS